MARPEDSTPVDARSSDSDRTPKMSDKYDHDPKVKDVEGLDHIDSNSTGARIGRQIEMEAENGIKYRTCSWQKVIDCSDFLPILYSSTSWSARLRPAAAMEALPHRPV